ncbi:MAG TPA: cation:proton antiporter [Geminicoccaceae bacterium]|nr:cation:proton antiporter [Geminicoccaceae bacterium]
MRAWVERRSVLEAAGMEAHHLDLAPLALLLVGATAFALLLAALRQPPLVGYILAGIVLGPSGLGLITDRDTINLLAELGVLVLLLVVGMHLSLRAFKAMYRTALLATSLQIAVSVALMLPLGHYLGWPLGRSVLFGFVLALSSTAVGIKMLEDVGELRNETGRCAVGVLIGQDLAVAPMLIIVAGLASEGGIGSGTLLQLGAALAALAALIAFLSRRQRMSLPFRGLLLRYQDLAPVVALALCLVAAAATLSLELSAGLGAFLVGLYIGNTTERRLMIRATEPIQSLLLMLFFLSIGLLIDVDFVTAHLGTVLLLLALVFLLNSVINVLILRAIGEPWRVAFLAGFALAQVGEFAFVLSAAGLHSGLIDDQAGRMVVAVIALSLMISPLWLELARRLHAMQAAPPESARELAALLYHEEARLMRERSARVVHGGAQLVHDGAHQLVHGGAQLVHGGAQLVQDGAQQLVQGGVQLVHGGAQLAVSLGEEGRHVLGRVLHRGDGGDAAKEGAGEAAEAARPPAAPDEPGGEAVAPSASGARP